MTLRLLRECIWLFTGLFCASVGIGEQIGIAYFLGAAGLWIWFGLVIRLDQEPREDVE